MVGFYKKLKFGKYYFNYYRIKCLRKLRSIFGTNPVKVPEYYAGKKVLSQEQFNSEIYQKLLSGEPFMVSRFGSNEILNSVEYLAVKYGYKRKMNKKLLKQLNINAGVFPYGEETAKKFAKLLLESSKEIDYLGAWFRNMEDYIIDEYTTNVSPLRLKFLEPYCCKQLPWSYGLKGKKVLVIHPFDNTIKRQYTKRKELFSDERVLPDFQLITLRAVQSAAKETTKFDDWFAALDYMYNEAMKIDFDVAVIGCGAYGMPLAARIKKAGKQAIHLGGSVQILFGIKGNRWDNDPLTNIFYNDSWCRPLPEDTPDSANLVEGACYW